MGNTRGRLDPAVAWYGEEIMFLLMSLSSPYFTLSVSRNHVNNKRDKAAAKTRAIAIGNRSVMAAVKQ